MSDVLMWLGAIMVSVGFGWFALGAGLIVGGIFVLAFGFTNGIPEKRKTS